MHQYMSLLVNMYPLIYIYIELSFLYIRFIYRTQHNI